MTKLKCWKKLHNRTYETEFKNEKEKADYLTLRINEKLFKPNKWEAIRKNKVVGIFIKKSQALKFANKYMKEHDKC